MEKHRHLEIEQTNNGVQLKTIETINEAFPDLENAISQKSREGTIETIKGLGELMGAAFVLGAGSLLISSLNTDLKRLGAGAVVVGLSVFLGRAGFFSSLKAKLSNEQASELNTFMFIQNRKTGDLIKMQVNN